MSLEIGALYESNNNLDYRLKELKRGLDDLPLDRKGTPSQNRAVQAAAAQIERFLAFHENDVFDGLSRAQFEDLFNLTKSVFQRIKMIKDTGGFNRWFFKSRTYTQAATAIDKMTHLLVNEDLARWEKALPKEVRKAEAEKVTLVEKDTVSASALDSIDDLIKPLQKLQGNFKLILHNQVNYSSPLFLSLHHLRYIFSDRCDFRNNHKRNFDTCEEMVDEEMVDGLRRYLPLLYNLDEFDRFTLLRLHITSK